MSDRTLTRADLVDTLFGEVGLPQNKCARLLNDVLNEIADCLAEGEPVKLNNFATFTVRHKGERIGRNPKTGEEHPIPSRRIVKFRPSLKLKHWINHPEDLPRSPRPGKNGRSPHVTLV